MAKRRRSLSFLERNQRVVGLLGLTLLLAGTAFALLLQGGFLTPTYTVTAYFSDAAGIRAGDFVTVAGLQAGEIKDVRIEQGAVAMDLGIEREIDLSADSRAEVVIETLLGRKSVALVSGRSDQPLEDGDQIPLDRTTTPIDIIELNDISVRLLEGSDAEAFETLMSEVTQITSGRTEEIHTIISGLERLTAAIDARQDQLARLLESLRTLSTTFGQRDQTIVSLIDNLDVVLGNLAERQQDLETLLITTDVASHETADLVRRNRTVLDSALAYLHRDLEVLNEHQLDLAATVAYLDQAVEGYSSVGYSQGLPNEWANIFVQSLGPAGVDALIGQCGTVDQFFDHYFGTDCHDAGGTARDTGQPPVVVEGGGAGAGDQPGGTDTTGQLPVPVEVPPLPCSIDDVVGSVLEGTGTVPAGTPRCEP